MSEALAYGGLLAFSAGYVALQVWKFRIGPLSRPRVAILGAKVVLGIAIAAGAIVRIFGGLR